MTQLQRRHQYWGPTGIEWTKWYNVSIVPKKLEKYEYSKGTKLLCEYREVETNEE